MKAEYEEKVLFLDVNILDMENLVLLKHFDLYYVPTSFFIGKDALISFQAVGFIEADKVKEELDKVVE